MIDTKPLTVKFNRHVMTVIDPPIEEPSQDTIENTLNLRQCSIEDAMRYGGPITRAAIGAMHLRGDKKHIVVDTKVNFLLPGFVPAIPGWHTDGVPRGESLNPGGSGPPNLQAQIEGRITAPRYHLLVTGTHSQTRFMNKPVNLTVEDGPNLYESMSRAVNKIIDPLAFFDAPPCQVVEWDWWNIHAAVPATGRGWRYLIRVTETDHIAPRTNPADFIRTQTQVYVPAEFGW